MRLTASLLFVVCCFLSNASIINCWESYELDLFDLVEEVGENFYDFFGISQEFDSNELKKAYRKLSLMWHPDKSDDPEAEKKFRIIASINDVLKDEQKRDRYNQVLEFGLPDWRQPIYYFRRARKLNTTELSIAISLIISIGHYFVMWAQYFEKKLTLDDRIGEVRKRLDKKQKKKKTSSELDEIDAALQQCYDTMPQPALKSTLPCRLGIWLFYLMLDSPSLIKSVLTRFKSNRKIAEREDITNDINNNSNFTNNSDNKRERDKQQQQQLHKSLNPTSCENAQITPVILSQTSSTSPVTLDESTTTKVNNKSKEWSDKEKADLIKAVTKYPPGASNRWQRIGDLVATRTAADCIAMEKSMKTNFSPSNFSNLNAASWNQSSDIDFVKDAPTLAYATIEPVMLEEKRAAWTQEQQALFEKGLKQFGKETVNRWERISELVSGKNKEECIERFKTLCEALKKK
jgi:DnaJ family protein C protein 1